MTTIKPLLTTTLLSTTPTTTSSTSSTTTTTTAISPALSVETNSIPILANETTTSKTIISSTTSATTVSSTTTRTSLGSKSTKTPLTVKIWAPIIAVAGTIIICLLIFFGVRRSRIKADAKRENQSDYEVPYEENQYEQPYRYSDVNGAQNNAENEEIYEVYHSDRDSIKYETYEDAEYEEYNIKNKK